MSATTPSLPPDFTSQLAEVLQSRRVNLAEPKALAQSILQLSDFYLQNPGAATPWNQSYAANAYLSYFLPLNLVRLRANLREVMRFLPDDSYSEIWDYGAGIGTTQWALEMEPGISPRPLYAVEIAPAAIEIYRSLTQKFKTRWTSEIVTLGKQAPKGLAIFSYSFLEMQQHLPDLNAFDHLLIVEPSSRDCGRSLMEWRSKFLERGFTALAPCTHAEACPLLVDSARDWCHMRVPFHGPDWWQALEEQLPMKNRTLTYSYLLVSRTVKDPVWRGAARAIGDTLPENGKTKQMICRGPKREFLSWLHKLGPAPRIPHGALIEGVDHAAVKGTELRPEKDSLRWTE